MHSQGPVIYFKPHFVQELGLNAVCLVFDPLRTTQGKLSIKALRLTKKIMEMYKAGDFTQEAYVHWPLNFLLPYPCAEPHQWDGF